MSQQSSPTPDPVAWMVRSGAGQSIGEPELVEALARGNAERYNRLAGWRDKPYTVVPLYDHPSALPATTPSYELRKALNGFALRIMLDIAGFTPEDSFKTAVALDEVLLKGFDATDVGAAAKRVVELAGVSPSEGSAPDTPEPEDDDDLANQVALQVLCRVFDDGVDVAMDEWRAFNAEGGFFWWARALGAFIRGRLDDQRVPPSAPDTKPDDGRALIVEAIGGSLYGWTEMQALTFRRRCHAWLSVSSSPPEGEDTQRGIVCDPSKLKVYGNYLPDDAPAALRVNPSDLDR